MTATPAQMVAEFHRVFGYPCRSQPTVPDGSELELRATLIEEEAAEAAEALRAGDLVGAAGELADLVYVAYGAAAHLGVDLDAVIAEIHRANMSKLGADGRPVLRADGKTLKGPGFVPADTSAVLRAQGAQL